VDKDTRNSIQRATQAGRTLLERTFSAQLEGIYDILLDGKISEKPGSHLSERQAITRDKLVAAVAHKRSTGLDAKEAVDAFLREAAFTTLNRFVALKMLEVRQLVQECISKGEDSIGFKEFTALAPGLVAVGDKGYQLYIETLFDEIGQEVKVLFDRREVASLLWPDRQTLLELLGILNSPELASVWGEDETIGWVYQYFNGDEERSQMREESQVPRNSHELAVRNQFFTPRYVVQFLTDNTLGRTWYEMMKGETELAHLDYLVRRPSEVFLAEGASPPESEVGEGELSQEEMLQQTEYVPFRVKKDPRDLRILDPACGSGHFLLYAFELLVSIYEEAWSDAGTAVFTETGTQLREDYGSVEDLRLAIPELILRHNLHGVDIDPRAAQIAALALWMRAQRAYNQFEMGRADRPTITKTNIVVAEPMPGDSEMVEEFAASLKPAVLGDLFKKMVEEMKLAGELGSLLKIEESIAKAVKDTEEEHRQGDLFVGKVESQDFWDAADEKIIAALGSFSESTAGSTGIRRRLFAGDAAQGVALIELMRKRFDVVLMNPPFGETPTRADRKLRANWASAANDIYAVFLLNGLASCLPEGVVGAITSRGFMKGRDLRDFRPKILGKSDGTMSLFVDLGLSVLDSAEVETAMFIIKRDLEPDFHTRFVDLRKKSRPELEMSPIAEHFRTAFVRQPNAFWVIPECAILYTANDQELDDWANSTRLDPEVARVTRGLNSSNDERFLRLWWEVPFPEIGNRYCYCAKGGEYRWLFTNIITVINWGESGEEIAAHTATRSTNIAQARRSSGYYFKSGLTLTYRNSDFSLRALPADCIFTNSAPVIIPHDSENIIPVFAAFLSQRYERLLGQVEKKGKYDTGRLGKLPAPDIVHLEGDPPSWAGLIGLLSEGERQVETSPYFGSLTVSALLGRNNFASEEIRVRFESLSRDFGYRVSTSFAALAADRLAARFEGTNELSSVVSFLIGVAFGRYRTTVNQSNINPFAAIATPPGLCVTGIGQSLFLHRSDRDSESPLIQAIEGVLDDCLEGSGETANSWYGIRISREDLENYITSGGGFYNEHLKACTGAFRKAPLYWPITIPSGRISIWCYYHALFPDTMYAVIECIESELVFEERKLNTLRQEAGSDPSSKERKTIDVQETFVVELRAFKSEVARIAPLWNPNLNDGVIINFAPLWRLVPQHKPWQKECKRVWDKLVKGDYDWAHLAMHLWPERVVPKCQDDRSLAIAHGLEDDFWYEDDDGKWQKRQDSDDRIEELIDERASTAVKASLDDLLSAPNPTGGSKRRGKRQVAHG
jgi:hypothetical protein